MRSFSWLSLKCNFTLFIFGKALTSYFAFPQDPYSMDSPHTKAHLLLQSHLSRAQLPMADYHTDTKSVLDQAIRILQAMVDIAADAGWLATTLRVQNLLQMIVQVRVITEYKWFPLIVFEKKIAKNYSLIFCSRLFAKGSFRPPHFFRKTVLELLNNVFVHFELLHFFFAIMFAKKNSLNFECLPFKTHRAVGARTRPCCASLTWRWTSSRKSGGQWWPRVEELEAGAMRRGCRSWCTATVR